jgi:hypothetical protein
MKAIRHKAIRHLPNKLLPLKKRIGLQKYYNHKSRIAWGKTMKNIMAEENNTTN